MTKKEWSLTQENFDALLLWLDPNREVAGQQYETIRLGLIKIFTCRGCCVPEELADETINRVARRLDDIADKFEGDRALYFYGVANNVFLEHIRRKPFVAPPPPPRDSLEVELEYTCLEQCMNRLASDNRQLILQYYQEEKRAKIDHRKRLAESLGIALNALRIRAHRIRLTLLECVQQCLREQEAW